MIAAPMFHSWGFVHFTLGMSLSSTLVLNRKFDPEATLSLTAQHECTALIVVPVMMQRILELDDDVLKRYDLSQAARHRGLGLGAARRDLRPLDGPVRRERLQPLRLDRGRLGEHRHAGGPARRAGHGRPRAARHDRASSTTTTASRSSRARPGASSSATRCSSRATRAAAARTSSTGCSPPATSATSTTAGRLFVDGRDDDMIVSGGENVFPAEVEDLLAGHDAIAEVAVFGVETRSSASG